MATARIVWDGLAEFRRALRNLPADLTDDAAGIVRTTAIQAAEAIRHGYPVRTGNLRRGVRVSFTQARGTTAGGMTPGGGVTFGVAGIVKNSAKHAWIFENGTAARHVKTLAPGRIRNYGTSRGSMPPGRVFIPIMQARRRGMMRQLIGVLQRAGSFQVIANAA